MGELRQRAGAQPSGHGSFARLRGAIAARRPPQVVAANAPQGGDTQRAPAEPRATKPAPSAAPALSAAPIPAGAAPTAPVAKPPQTVQEAALLGLVVGLMAGCSIGVARRLRSRAAAVAAVVLAATTWVPGAGRAQEPYADALASKFVGCYEAEGNPIGDEDRAALGSVAAELGALVPASAGGPLCPGVADARSCGAALAGLSCEQVAAGLSTSLAVPLTEPAPEAWAESYGKALSAKVTACAAAEAGATPLAPEDLAALNDFGAGLARLLGSLVATGGCTVDSGALATCLDGIQAASCPATLDAVSSTLAPAVPTNGSPSAEPTPSMEDTEAAAEQDAPALSDAELDQQIDALAANTKSPVPFLGDVCARLLTCGADAGDENAP